jgi:hypothetical protein
MTTTLFSEHPNGDPSRAVLVFSRVDEPADEEDQIGIRAKATLVTPHYTGGFLQTEIVSPGTWRFPERELDAQQQVETYLHELDDLLELLILFQGFDLTSEAIRSGRAVIVPANIP